MVMVQFLARVPLLPLRSKGVEGGIRVNGPREAPGAISRVTAILLAPLTNEDVARCIVRGVWVE